MPPQENTSKFDLHKVFATLGLVLIPVVLLVAGVWIYVNGKDTAPKVDEEDSIKISTSSAKTATGSANTSDWKELTNKTYGYKIKYPSNWYYNGTSEKPNCDDTTVFLAPSEDLLGKCASGYGGLVIISKVDLALNQEITNLKLVVANFKQEEVTINDKKVQKITGTQNGNAEIYYIYELDNGILTLHYYQADQVTSDYSKTFEQIVYTLKFL